MSRAKYAKYAKLGTRAWGCYVSREVREVGGGLSELSELCARLLCPGVVKSQSEVREVVMVEERISYFVIHKM